MRHSPKRKSPPIDSASIESSLRLNGSTSSIRLVTDDTDGLTAGDRISYDSTANGINRPVYLNQQDADAGANAIERSESFISTTSSNSENTYLTPNPPSSPHTTHAHNITNLTNLNISQSSLPRQSAEVTGVGEIRQPHLTYTHSFDKNSMSANLTSSSAVYEKGLPEVQPNIPSKSPLRGARNKRKWIIIGASVIAAIVVIVLVIALPVTVSRRLYTSSRSNTLPAHTQKLVIQRQ